MNAECTCDAPGCHLCEQRTSRHRRIWAERDALLRIARRRTACEQDAEDAVSEAQLRAMQAEYLDDERIGAWLTTVTINLCTDMARKRLRAAKHLSATVPSAQVEDSPEQRVVDADTAARVVQRFSRLPARQREALMLRTAGLSVDRIADRLGLSYKAVESLLSRARATLRDALAWIPVAVLGTLRYLRDGARAAPAATATCAVALAWLVIPAPTTVLQPGTLPAVVAPAYLQPERTPGPYAGNGTSQSPQAPIRERARGPRASAPGTDPPDHGTLLVPHAVQRGPMKVDSGGASRDHGDESAMETVTQCLQDGIVVSADMIGCPR
ncbi:MAG: hypothetical protein QOG53_3148 [Frankiales bacterium]|jgi:RNA polymerase sigma factor (sigma-70 family)|nr:hypothetical protein [Frankiales bacterium]